MSNRYSLRLALSPEDAELLAQLAYRLGTDRSTILRWALRWYGCGGPWRDADEPLLSTLEGRMEGLQVAPLIHREAS